MTAPRLCGRCHVRVLHDAQDTICIGCAEAAWKAGELCCGCSRSIAELGGTRDEGGYALCAACGRGGAPCRGCDAEADVEVSFDGGTAGWCYCARCLEEVLARREENEMNEGIEPRDKALLVITGTVLMLAAAMPAMAWPYFCDIFWWLWR